MTKISDKLEKFEVLVWCAQDFISENAKDKLNRLRGTNSNSCYELLENMYEPMITDIETVDDIDFQKAVVKRMCVQLQNYQKMPQAVEYTSFGDDDNNKIFQYVYENINSEIEWNDIYDYLYDAPSGYYTQKQYKDGAYNFALKKYSKGLADFIKNVKTTENYFEVMQDYCKYIDRLAKERKFDEITKILTKFSKNIYYLDTALSYDFFKELYCKNLVKPDIHIKEIFKRYIYNELPDENTIAKDFISMGLTLELSPYYLDKILWLCCTGNFYKDGITIQKMTRRNFFKFIDNKIKQEK